MKESLVNTPLELEGWLEFNRLKWGVRAERFSFSLNGSELPRVDAVLYIDKKDRICQPPRNAYTPVFSASTPTNAPYRLYRQWLEVAEPLVDEFLRHGQRGTVLLPPEIGDVRPWQWAGFRTGTKYTLYVDFPYDFGQADRMVRKQVKKAERTGYFFERSSDMADVVRCLQETEARQGFKHLLSLADLEAASELMGDEHFRCYICRAQDGEVASARIVLHQRGARAVDWVAGTTHRHLKSGATQLIIERTLKDLEESGAAGFDFAGANIPSVAASKATWGARLVPYHTIEAYSLRSLAGLLRGWRRFRKSGKRR